MTTEIPQRKDYALTHAQRMDARLAFAVLAGTGMTLEEAARRAVQGKSAAEKVSLAEGIQRFLRTRMGKRSTTLMWYQQKLGIFEQWERAGALVDTISRGELSAYIAAQPVSESTRAAYARAIRACWSWMIEQDPPLAGVDSTLGLVTQPPASKHDIGFLTVEQARAVMKKTMHRAAVALMLFAGVRPEEVAGRDKPPMTWACIDPVGKMIIVPSACSKTGRRRTLEGLPDAFWRWVGKPKGEGEPIATALGINVTRGAKQRAGIKDWPHDALRHTFATYAVALTSDPGRVSLWLGHEDKPTMLFRHYRGLATKAQAEAFFALKPE